MRGSGQGPRPPGARGATRRLCDHLARRTSLDLLVTRRCGPGGAIGSQPPPSAQRAPGGVSRLPRHVVGGDQRLTRRCLGCANSTSSTNVSSSAPGGTNKVATKRAEVAVGLSRHVVDAIASRLPKTPLLRGPFAEPRPQVRTPSRLRPCTRTPGQNGGERAGPGRGAGVRPAPSRPRPPTERVRTASSRSV